MTKLQMVHAEIAELCGVIAKLFRPGAKVTVIVRNPESDKEPHSASILVGDDSIDTVIEALTYLKARDEQRLPTEYA